MKKSPAEIEEFKDGHKRRDAALTRALGMAPAPFTPKPKVTPKKKKTGK